HFRESVLLGPRAAEIDRCRSDCVAQSAEQVTQEERLGEGRLGVAHVGVPGAPAIILMVPAHGMVCAVRTAFVALLVDLDKGMDGRIDGLEVVELVLADYAVGKSDGRWVSLVEDVIRALAHIWIAGVAVEPGAGESAIPGPVVLGISRGVDPDVT